MNLGGLQAEDFGCDLREHRGGPLSNVRGSCEEGNSTVGFYLNPGRRRILDARVADAVPHGPDPDASFEVFAQFARFPGLLGFFVKRFDGLKGFQDTHAVHQFLIGSCLGARLQDVDLPDFQGIQAQLPGQEVHLRLVGHGDLRYAEASHGPGDGMIGVGAETLHLHVFNFVGARGVHRRPGRYREPIGSVSSRVTKKPGSQGEQFAVPVCAGLDFHFHGMALGRGETDLLPGVNQTDGAAEVIQSQADKSLDRQIKF